MPAVPPVALANKPPTDPQAPGTRRRSPLSQVDPAVKRSVWHRDGHVCRFCGFHALRYQEVVVLGGNACDVDHMVTACLFCHQCFHLPEVAAMRSGVLLWLPELAQAELHHAARDIYIARLTRHSGERARKVLDALMARREPARTRLGTDEPRLLAQRLASTDPAQVPDLGDEALRGIRLLPLDRRILRSDDLEFNQFPQVLAYWRAAEGPYRGEREFRWMARLEQMLAAGDGPEATALAQESPVEPMPTHAQLGARLLRDAAQFLRNLASQNAGMREQMQSIAQTYADVAGLLEEDPLRDFGLAGPGTGGEGLIHVVASRLMEDSAGFFESVGAQNPPLAEQMNSNAEIYRELAHWVRTDPLSRPPDDA